MEDGEEQQTQKFWSVILSSRNKDESGGSDSSNICSNKAR